MTNESARLLDYWLPPEGAGRGLACLALSFTLDPDFFEKDCLSRFLGMDTARGEAESDLAFLIEEEEKLAESRVTVVVDRSYAAEGRSLRWDILPVGVRGGLQHAKVSILVWERLVRFVVGSANLTPAGYRLQVETGMALDLFDGSELPRSLFADLRDSVESIVSLAPGRAEEPGPKQRAIATLNLVGRRIEQADLPDKLARRQKLKIAVVACGPGQPAMPQMDAVWKGGPARAAAVLSPFFDSVEKKSGAVVALLERLAQRGSRSVRFVLPVDQMESGTVVRAPKTLRESVPRRISSEFQAFHSESEKEIRRLHAKAILLENDDWVSALVGSSNFTTAGLGLASRGNLEINLALGAPRGSKPAKALQSLVPDGEALDLTDVEWAPEEDTDSPDVVLPWGFVECLIAPGEPARLWVRLDQRSLPKEWSVLHPVQGGKLFGSQEWQEKGRPGELNCQLPSGPLPLFVRVRWKKGSHWQSTDWAVNVTELAKLPPPSELRDLPVEALLQALASTRPIHEALAQSLTKKAEASLGLSVELDPLKRYLGTSRLLHRARRISSALEGLRRRLERPAANLDALEWRLRGPLGPKTVAEGLAEQLEKGKTLPGEAEFLLAELALTMSRVNWHETAHFLPTASVLEKARQVLEEVKSMRTGSAADRGLERYIGRAFQEAQL